MMKHGSYTENKYVKVSPAFKILFFLVFMLSCPRVMFGESLVYVVNNGNDTISVLDADTGHSLVTTIMLQGGAGANIIAVNPAGDRLYVAEGAVDAIEVFDTTTFLAIAGSPFDTTPEGTGPFGITIDTTGTRVFVSLASSDVVAMYDADMNVIDSAPSGGTTPRVMSLSSDGTKLYVPNFVNPASGPGPDGNLVRFDVTATTLTQVAAVSSGGLLGPGMGFAPNVCAINPAEDQVYVANTADGVLSRFDLTLGTSVSAPMATSGASSPVAVTFNPNGSAVYVANAGTNTVLILNPLTFMPIGSGSVSSGGGMAPFVTAVNPAGDLLYTTNTGGTEVLSVRTLTTAVDPGAEIAGSPFSGFSGPFGVAFGPASPSDALSNLNGERKKNIFGLQYEVMNVLTWQGPSITPVFGYVVYRDGVKIATLNDTTFEYMDHNRPLGVASTYAVASLDALGVESSPLTVTIN